MEHLGVGSEQSFRENYAYCLDEAIDREELKRDAKWTESLAVGTEAYVKKVGKGIRNRVKVEVVEDKEDRSTWVVREPVEPNSYRYFLGQKTSAKPPNDSIRSHKSLML